MSTVIRPGVFPPYYQVTKHGVKSLVFPGAKELLPAAGKDE